MSTYDYISAPVMANHTSCTHGHAVTRRCSPSNRPHSGPARDVWESRSPPSGQGKVGCMRKGDSESPGHTASLPFWSLHRLHGLAPYPFTDWQVPGGWKEPWLPHLPGLDCRKIVHLHAGQPPTRPLLPCLASPGEVGEQL